jgi:hypothetical protein
MSLPQNHPFNDLPHPGYTTSIGGTPVAASVVSTKVGRVVGASGVDVGGATGTVTMTVATPAGTVGTFTITGGAGNVGYVDFGGNAANASVNPGDKITVTPSGATGATIPGLVSVVIR